MSDLENPVEAITQRTCLPATGERSVGNAFAFHARKLQSPERTCANAPNTNGTLLGARFWTRTCRKGCTKEQHTTCLLTSDFYLGILEPGMYMT